MFRNMEKSVEEAKIFIAWLSVASNGPLVLSHCGFGESQGFGPCSHERTCAGSAVVRGVGIEHRFTSKTLIVM